MQRQDQCVTWWFAGADIVVPPKSQQKTQWSPWSCPNYGVWYGQWYLNSTTTDRYKVWNFLDKILQLHYAPILESLGIQLGKQCPVDTDVGKWVSFAVDRHIQELEIEMHCYQPPKALTLPCLRVSTPAERFWNWLYQTILLLMFLSFVASGHFNSSNFSMLSRKTKILMLSFYQAVLFSKICLYYEMSLMTMWPRSLWKCLL